MPVVWNWVWSWSGAGRVFCGKKFPFHYYAMLLWWVNHSFPKNVNVDKTVNISTTWGLLIKYLCIECILRISPRCSEALNKRCFKGIVPRIISLVHCL